jgi:hypothetical protein
MKSEPVLMKRNDIQAALALQLAQIVDVQTYYYLADKAYYLPSFEVARRIIRGPEPRKGDWRERVAHMTLTERDDCDDRAHLLKSDFIRAWWDSALVHEEFGHDARPRSALAAGVIGFETITVDPFAAGGGGHIMNWMLNSDGRVRLIEPSTGEIFDSWKTDANGGLLLERDPLNAEDDLWEKKGLLARSKSPDVKRRVRVFQLLG